MIGAIVTGLRALHYAVLAFGLTGWAIPSATALIVYLIFLPLIVVQWRLNNNTCILDNVESRITTGAWRAPDRNPGEGQFIGNLVARVFGVRLSDTGVDRLVYGLLALFFVAAAVHLSLLTP